MVRSSCLVLLAALAGPLAGCATRPVTTPLAPASGATTPVSVPGVPAAAAEASAVLNGTVTYRQRIALPEGAVVSVRVEDVSLADAPATTVSSQEIRPTSQVPIPFALAYNPSAINVSHRYAVRAEIRDAEGVLRWTTTTNTPVFTNGAPIDGVEIVVDMVD